MPGSRPTEKTELPLPDKHIAIHEQLRIAKIPHAFGGDVALAYYAEPSVRIHIDLHVFVPAENWQYVVDALSSLGPKAGDPDPIVVQRDGQHQLWWGDSAINLFFAYDEIHEEMRKETRKVPFADTSLPILSPEHLAICKAMFDRPKDWLDIEQMLIATDALEIGEIEAQLHRMVGADNPRLQRLVELKKKLAIES